MQTKVVKIDPQAPNPEAIKEAAEILKKGGIVAFPTETVYGLAADYNNKEAINKLYSIKKRPKDKPFTIHIARKAKILDFIDGPDELAKRLIDKFWPGPLTIILKTKDSKTLGFRMSSNQIALNLIESSGLSIVAPSANISGEPAATQPADVLKSFSGAIDMLIDAGPTKIGIHSTVVDVSTMRPKILRNGSNVDEVRAIVNEDKKITNILIVCAGNSCRSPMAEGLFKKELTIEGFDVKSAGVIATDGMPPSTEATEVMKRYANMDISSFRSNKLTKELTGWADLILVMDKTQKAFIEETFSTDKEKVYLFKEFAGSVGDEVNISDPVGKPFLAYEESYKQIKKSADIIIKKLRRG